MSGDGAAAVAVRMSLTLRPKKVTKSCMVGGDEVAAAGGTNRQKSENCATSETPWPLDYKVQLTVSLSAVRPLTCSLL